MIDEKDVKLIEDMTEIKEILESKIRNRKIIFTDWYKIGIMRKGIPEEKFDEIFPQFDKIFKIEEERKKNQKKSYKLLVLFKLIFDLLISIYYKHNSSHSLKFRNNLLFKSNPKPLTDTHFFPLK